MEATKTFTLTIKLDGGEDYGDISEKLRDAANDIPNDGDIFAPIKGAGRCEDSNGNVIATWEVR